MITVVRQSIVLCLLWVSASVALADPPYAALVVDVESEAVLFERNAHEIRHPASLTKMMTLYMVFDALERGRLRLNQHLWVSSRAAARPPTKLGLKRGDRITVKQAILALVTRSANDVATVIAENLAPTEYAFGQRMTLKARELGMTRTKFRNASGLPDPLQVTTAWDMYRLARALQRNFPRYYPYFSRKAFYFRNRRYYTHNHLLDTYPGTDGIKTGFIRASGYNLVASVRRNDRRVIGVVFGGKTSRARDAHMKAILTQGFAKLEDGVQVARAPKPGKLTLIARSIGLVKPEQRIPPAAPVTVQGNGGTPVRFDTEQLYWNIQVGAFSRAAAAERRVSEALEAAPDMLFQARTAILPLWKSGKTLYRAWFKGLSQEQAHAACRTLKRKNIDCFTLPPT